MAVWDFLKNAFNIGNNEAPKIEPVLIGDAQYKPATKLDRVKDIANLGLSKLKDSKLYQGIAGIDDKIENAFFGKLIDNPVENTTITQDNNGNTTISSGVGTPTREGGIINDFINGTRENYTTKFNPQNLMGNDKKGFVYRLGEGLGTIGRMLESPLGRGLAVAGAVGALGGSAGDALAYGLGTTAQNQQIKANDRLYRDSLIDAEQNSLKSNANFQKLPFEQQQTILNNVANKYNNIRGFVDNNAYGNLMRAQQLRDNAEWRKLQNETMQDMKNREFEYRKKQDAIENALRARGIEIQENKASGNKNFESPKIILNNVEKLWKETPQGKAFKGTSKAKAYQTGIGNFLGINNNDVTAYLAIAESMVTPLARQIAEEKGNVSDRDINRARAMLPQVTDSYEQGIAKINAVRNLLNDLEKTNTTNQIQQTSQKDSLGIL